MTRLSFSSHQLSFKWFLLVAILVVGTLSGVAHALQFNTISGIQLQSRNFDWIDGQVVLEGDVHIIFSGQHIICDRATINTKKKTIEAFGQVSMQTTEMFAQAEKITYNYEKELGTFHNGYIQAGQVLFEGSIIEKTGKNEFEAENIYFTTCSTCPPAWSMRGRRIKAEIGGYAHLRSTTFRILDFPVLWFPYLILPLKSNRQTGFLPPELEFEGKSGVGLGLSFYYVIDRSQDAMMTLKQSRRGQKVLGNYRYVFSEDSKGEFNGAFIRDNVFNDDLPPGADIDRWFMKYQHHYLLPNDYIQHMDLNFVSDLRYPKDFQREIDGYGDPALENRVSLTQNKESYHLSMDSAYYINLLKTDPLEDNTDAIHRFPELKFNLTDRELGESGFFFDFNFNYVNFARDSFSYDDASIQTDSEGRNYIEVSDTRDGLFNPATDYIRTGQRLDLSPTLSYPFQIGSYFDVMPRLTFRETQYRFNARTNDLSVDYSPSAARRYLRTDLSMRTSFFRVFERENAQPMKHEIQPEIIFSDIPWSRRPDHPFFGDFQENEPFYRTQDPLTNFDLLGQGNFAGKRLQFDYNDRNYDLRTLTYSINNKLIQKYLGKGREATYRQTVLFSVRQSYDFIEARNDNAEPWSDIQSLLSIQLPSLETITTHRYYPYQRESDIATRIRLRDSLSNFVEFAYNRDLRFDEERKINYDNRIEQFGLSAGTRKKYVDFAGTVNYNFVTYKIDSWGYKMMLKPPGDCWAIGINHLIVPGNRPDIRITGGFNYGGGMQTF